MSDEEIVVDERFIAALEETAEEEGGRIVDPEALAEYIARPDPLAGVTSEIAAGAVAEAIGAQSGVLPFTVVPDDSIARYTASEPPTPEEPETVEVPTPRPSLFRRSTARFWAFLKRLQHPDFVIDSLTLAAATAALAVFLLLIGALVAGVIGIGLSLHLPVTACLVVFCAGLAIITLLFGAVALRTSIVLTRLKNRPSLHVNDVLRS